MFGHRKTILDFPETFTGREDYLALATMLERA
jgi:hypothetical protein